MKFWKASALVLGLALLSHSTLAWSNEDHEIFDLVSALESAEGKGASFYSYLNITKGASEKELSKAYRKRSLELHPDKNPDDKVVAEKFARLGTINAILRDAERRARYDHFYEHGVPRWRGTGYYYSRYRPGLGGVLASLVVFSVFIHWFILAMNWYVSVVRLRMFQQQALEHAWGASKKPLAGRKRLRLKTGDAEGPGIPGINGGRPTRAGQQMEMVVEGDKVYVVEGGEETLLEESAAVWPSFVHDTWPKAVYLRATGQAPPPSAAAAAGEGSDEETTEVVTDKAGNKKTVVVKKPRGPARGVTEAATKVGGVRKRTVPSRPSTPKGDEKK